MNDDEIWELARKPVTEFVESIKQMGISVERLVNFYIKYTGNVQSKKGIQAKTSLNRDNKNSQEEKEEEDSDEKQILSPLARAKLELAIVFSINACYWMYLVSHGEDPLKNEISKDIERVRLFMNRAKEVEIQLLPDKNSSGKRPKIDKEASKRLCMNNISLKSEWG